MKLTEKEALIEIEGFNKEGKNGWNIITKYFYLDEQFIERYKNRLNWYDIFMFHNLNDLLKEKYKEFNTLDNRDFSSCYWCGVQNKIAYYRKNGKLIKCIDGVVYDFYYCPKCLR